VNYSFNVAKTAFYRVVIFTLMVTKPRCFLLVTERQLRTVANEE